MVAIKTKIKKINKAIHLINLCNKALNEAVQCIQIGFYREAVQIACINTNRLFVQNSLNEQEQNQLRKAILTHPIKDYFHQDPFTNHSYQKPRGYSGDATLLDYIYRIKGAGAETSFIGKGIFAATIESSPCVSVRWRAQHLAEKIELIANKKNQAIDVLSIASGHLREVTHIKNFEEKIAQFDALDQDEASNTVVRSDYQHCNIKVIDESIRYILENKLAKDHYDFIYSAGLLDYLKDKIAKSMIAKIYQSLKSGGKLLVANFTPGMLEQGYMETFMDWHLIYRNETQMLELCEAINERIKPEDLYLYRDPNCNVVYLEIQKN